MKIKQNGYIALMTVLIVMAVVLTTSTTAVLLAIGEAQSGLSLFKGEDTITFVQGCVEDVMLKIRSNSTYSGTSITRPEGTCTITYTATNPNWNILVSTNSTTYKRQIRVLFTQGASGLTLTSWKEE